MQNAALRVAVEHDLLDYLLDNGRPRTEPITTRQLMERHSNHTLPEALISKLLQDTPVRKPKNADFSYKPVL